MKILAFESSAVSASAAVLHGGRLLAESYQNIGLTHSQTLLPMAEAMLKNSGIGISEIDLVAVANGPGSFTGIRIGISTVKGLCWAAHKRCVGVSTLLSMAYNLVPSERIICCVMDARAGQVYNGLFTNRDGSVVRRCEDRAVSLEELAAEIKKSERSHVLVGDGAEMCYNNLLERGAGNIVLAPENLRFQNAYGVAMAAAGLRGKEEAGGADALGARYLRLPQAERERLEKIGRH